METVLAGNVAIFATIGVVLFFFIILFVFLFVWIWDVSKNDKSKNNNIVKLQKAISSLESQLAALKPKEPSALEFKAIIEDLERAGAPEQIIESLGDIALMIEAVDARLKAQLPANISVENRVGHLETKLSRSLAAYLCSARLQIRDEVERRMEIVFKKQRTDSDKLFGIAKSIREEDLHDLETRLIVCESALDIKKLMEELDKGSNPPPPDDAETQPPEDTEPPEGQKA